MANNGIFNSINASTTSGSQLATLLNLFKDTIVSGLIGNSRPVNILAGGYWIDNTNNPVWDYKVFDGTNDITVFSINTTTGATTISTADSLIEILKRSDDAIGPKLKFLKERIAGSGQTVTNDAIGEIEFKGTRDDTVDVIQARIKGVSTDSVTASAQGSYLSFEVSEDNTAAMVEVVRIINNRMGIGTETPTTTLHVEGTGITNDRISDDAVGSEIIHQKRRVSGVGQVQSGDVISTERFKSIDNTGAIIEPAKDVVVATQTHTTTAQGTKKEIYVTKTGQASQTKQVEIADEITFYSKVNVTDLEVTNLIATNITEGTVVEIEDAQIVLNKGGTQANANTFDSGFLVEMTDATDAKIGYDSTKASKFIIGEVGSEKEIVDVSSSQELSNKSIRTPSRSDVKQDTYANLVTYASTATNGQKCFSTDFKKYYGIVDGLLVEEGSGSGSSGIEYCTNGGFEADLTGWVAFDDGSVSTPVDGTGGSEGALNVTRITSGTLRGSGSMKFDPTGDAQGEGRSYAFTIDEADKGKPIMITLEYLVGGTGYLDGNLSLWVYDIDASELIEVSDRTIKNSGLVETHICNFQPNNITSNDFRLIIMNTVTTSTWDVTIDNVSIGPRKNSQSGLITDFTDVTMTSTWTTNTTITAKRKIIGDTAKYQVRMVFSGAPSPAVALKINLPYGDSIDLAKLLTTSGGVNSSLGSGNTFDGTSYFPLKVGQDSSASSVYIQALNASGTYLTQATNVTPTVPSTLGSGDEIYVEFELPLLGRSTNQVVVDEYSNRSVVVLGAGNGGTVLTASVTDIDFTEVSDNTSSWNGNQFVAPTSDVYDFDGMIRITTTTAITIRSYIGGTLSKDVGTMDAANNVVKISGSVYLTQGQVLSFRSSVGVTLSNNTQNHYITISRKTAPSIKIMPEKIIAKYNTNLGQPIPNNADTIIDFDDKIEDSHGAVTTGSSWKFTAQDSRLYTLKVEITSNATGWTEQEQYTLYLYKNGSFLEVLRAIEYPATPSAASLQSIGGSTTLRLNKGDYIDVRLYQNTGASINLFGTATYNNITITSEN
jgi:hypothetical protein